MKMKRRMKKRKRMGIEVYDDGSPLKYGSLAILIQRSLLSIPQTLKSFLYFISSHFKITVNMFQREERKKNLGFSSSIPSNLFLPFPSLPSSIPSHLCPGSLFPGGGGVEGGARRPRCTLVRVRKRKVGRICGG